MTLSSARGPIAPVKQEKTRVALRSIVLGGVQVIVRVPFFIHVPFGFVWERNQIHPSSAN